jgi:hypothetical protein
VILNFLSFAVIYVNRLSGPPKLKREADSGEEEEVANKVKY